MEIQINNKYGVKHHITVTRDDATIIRMRDLGGTPKVIKLTLDSDITFKDAMKKFKHLAALEDDVYEMIAQHTNNS